MLGARRVQPSAGQSASSPLAELDRPPSPTAQWQCRRLLPPASSARTRQAAGVAAVVRLLCEVREVDGRCTSTLLREPVKCVRRCVAALGSVREYGTGPAQVPQASTVQRTTRRQLTGEWTLTGPSHTDTTNRCHHPSESTQPPRSAWVRSPPPACLPALAPSACPDPSSSSVLCPEERWRCTREDRTAHGEVSLSSDTFAPSVLSDELEVTTFERLHRGRVRPRISAIREITGRRSQLAPDCSQ